ncbi:hypothetical protein H2203_008785 [Taxawa tesnikishii (nom. ined.)]|nr:hypothetical protein H2203_008785 [Dothideales sp. JES 119]
MGSYAEDETGHERRIQDRPPSSPSRGESDRLLRAFVAASNDIDFVASIPDTTFSQILHTIRPEKLLLPLAQIHTTLSAATAHKMGVTPIHQVVEDYLHAVLDVLTVRKEAGKHLNIGDYTMLLKCARQTGSWPVAKSLWNAMIRDGITPNTPCYNHYMASMILKDVYDARTRHRIRVTPLHMRARTVKVQGSGFRNYRVGDGGIKSRVMKIFSEMLSNEAVADEETFRIVIEGAGREGDLTVIKSVLKKVWEINVDGLMSADDASLLPPPTQLPERSLLYPTDGLLFTIAHAFSINNNIPAALRLVDYISRQYRVPITDRVWEVLFEWTYVLSKHRVKYEDPLRQGDLLGQLPKQSLKNLWDTMTGAPYYYSPLHPYRTRVAYETLRSALDERSPRHAGGIEELQRDLDQADLLRQRNLGYLKRWLRLLLRAMRSYNRVNKDLEWSTRMIPRILSEWADFAPRVVRYETAGGNVEILFRPQCDVDEERRRGEERARRIAKVLQARPRFLGQNWTPRKWMARTSHERLSEDGPPQGT